MRNFSFKIWIWLTILLLLWQLAQVLSIKNQSKMCRPYDLPCKPDYSQECFMKYYKLNSTECRDMTFSERSLTNENSLGTVELKSYLYNLLSFKTTGFNVTFKNIKWRNLKFRFMQWGFDMKNTCREFNIMGNAEVEELFYDCLWSGETYEGHTFLFDYEASDYSVREHKTFSFTVPYAFNIDEEFTSMQQWQIFIYVEMVPGWFGFGPSQFTLYWQPLPHVFSVQSYNVSVLTKESKMDKIIHTEVVKCNDSESCRFFYSEWLRSVRFGVQPLCKGGIQCGTSYTIYYKVGEENIKPFLVGVACTTVAVPVAWYILSLIRKYLKRKILLSIKTSPKVLIIYSSSVPSHANVVLNLAEYLQSFCKIEPLVDELHISLSRTRSQIYHHYRDMLAGVRQAVNKEEVVFKWEEDPFKWCNQSFKQADIVMVVASPRFGSNKSFNSIYRNIDALLLRMLRESLGTDPSKKKYFLLMMPYSRLKDVPSEAKNLRKFHFPRDLNKILGFIHGHGALAGLFGCEFPGGRKGYELFGDKLHRAIEEAHEYLKSETESMEESAMEENICFQHKLLALKPGNVVVGVCSPEKNRALKELAKEAFADYPGTLEGINLLNDVEGGVEMVLPPEKAVEGCITYDIKQLNL